MIILVAGFKGGVGKSTIANFLAEKLKDSYILNLDAYQDNQDFNSSKTLNVAFNEDLQDKIKDSGICIIDSGGFDDPRLYDIDIDLFIFPTLTDKRSIKITLDTAVTILAKSRSSKKTVMFVINNYFDEKRLKKAKELLKLGIQQALKDGKLIADQLYLNEIKHSGAIETAIDTRKSLSELYLKNKAAYQRVNQEFEKLTSDVREILGEEVINGKD